ncbi:H/ACA ribonucleoprotein complex subunit 1-like [Olea europaea var. sylvestris]|uniref:H/ACA ribonucleoprotein complex subunit 1-like n=1 Tax=Olea europaea var. sylvestris TaxID=158386 RepID=UPI000C1CEBBC|nr:H/ACA ribonucleoprotein complex subunit 1-like [Olea europaea var. sylvestris]
MTEGLVAIRTEGLAAIGMEGVTEGSLVIKGKGEGVPVKGIPEDMEGVPEEERVPEVELVLEMTSPEAKRIPEEEEVPVKGIPEDVEGVPEEERVPEVEVVPEMTSPEADGIPKEMGVPVQGYLRTSRGGCRGGTGGGEGTQGRGGTLEDTRLAGRGLCVGGGGPDSGRGGSPDGWGDGGSLDA